MNASTKPILDAEPALGISIQYGVDERRQIVFQTHVPLGASAEEVNAVLDHAMVAADRQEARYELVKLRRDLEETDRQLGFIKEDFKNIETNARERWERSNKRGEFKLSESDLTARKNSMATIKRYEDAVAALKRKIAAQEKIVEATG